MGEISHRIDDKATTSVGWGSRILRLHLCGGVIFPSTKEFSGYDNEQFDSETPVKLELWEMQSIPSLSSLPSPLWSGVVASYRVPSMDQIELTDI